jgi:hypothetical protein
MAKADIGKSIGTAISCGASLKRIFPFFLVNLVFLVVIAAFFDNAVSFMSSVVMKTISFADVMTIVPAVLSISVVSIVLFFVTVYFEAGLADNARNFWLRKEVSFRKSLKSIKPTYVSLVGATILVVLISMILNFIPFVGWILAIIVSWLFLFVMPAVVISKNDAVGGLEDSYKIFMKNKLRTFAFWLVLIVISGVFSILAFVPLFIAALPAFAAVPAVGFIAALKANFALLIVGGVISSFLLGYVKVFSESAKTFYYIQSKKK